MSAQDAAYPIGTRNTLPPRSVVHALPMRTGVLGSYGPTLPARTEQLGERTVWTSDEEPYGITAVERRLGESLVCCFGDRIGGTSSAPDVPELKPWLDWSRAAMLRGCGAICGPRNLTLWTDAAAACPLFYAFDPAGQPVFSTRAKLLVDLLPQPREFVFADGTRPLPGEGRSVFAGIRAVPPGTVLELERDKPRWRLRGVHRYFRLPVPQIRSMETAQVLAREALESSVRTAASDVDEVSVTLSGGVDSSSVAAIAHHLGKRVLTYTVGSPFGNEFRQAGEVAPLIGSEHHEFMMTLEDLEALLPNLILALETWDPVTLQIAAPAAFAYRKSAQMRLAGKAIFLTGYGADLIFAGVADTTLPECQLESFIRKQVRLTVPTNEFSPSYAGNHGITVRYPFWSPMMLTTALSMRARLKVCGGAVKYVLRSAAEAWLPSHVAWREKVGIHEGTSMHRLFSECLGESTWEGQNRVLRKLASRVLLEEPAVLPGIVAEEMSQCASF